MSVKNVFRDISDILDQGWFSRILLVAQFYLAFSMTTWGMAVGSTAVALGRDLLGTAALIGAVAAAPQALLMLATSKYVELRNTGKTGNS